MLMALPSIRPQHPRDGAMLFRRNHSDRVGELAKRLHDAQAVTAELIADVVAEACPRAAAASDAGRTARIDALIAAGAWSDVALELVQIELPQWQLRRLLYEDGAWHCALSRAPNLPMAVDDTMDAVHDDLPLAILSAFIGVQRARTASGDDDVQSVPRLTTATGRPVCCDNFA